MDLDVTESTDGLWEKANTTQVSKFGTGFTWGRTAAVSLITS